MCFQMVLTSNNYDYYNILILALCIVEEKSSLKLHSLVIIKLEQVEMQQNVLTRQKSLKFSEI